MTSPETWHLGIKIFEPCLVLDFDVECLICKTCDNWTEARVNSKNEVGSVEDHAGGKRLAICLSDGKLVVGKES
jgi:hypothetical protein